MKLLTSLFIAALATTSINATELSVDEIIKRANHAAFYQGDDGSSVARMKIVDEQGRVQMRQFNVLRRDIEDGGDQQFLIAFSRPSDVKGMMFRVEKHITSDDDRWLFLPALDLVKRISASDKRTSFVGSHFYYEDISGRNTSLDNFELIDQTPTHYVIKAVPKDPSVVEFASYVVEIKKDVMLPTKISYTNSSGDVYRVIEAKKIKVIDGYPTVVSSQVSLPLTGAKTLMQFKGVKYNKGIPQTVFSERSLRNPPKRWLK
ncbi:MAG: outer membrane lipoprotein-sorting protein [Psychrobium sp.]